MGFHLTPTLPFRTVSFLHLQNLNWFPEEGGCGSNNRHAMLNLVCKYNQPLICWFMQLAFWGPTAPHACPSGANICLRQTFYFIWICIEQTKLFGRDILLYMNLHRAKKMFGRDNLLYMKLHRAKKITLVKSFHANFFLFLLQWYCK